MLWISPDLKVTFPRSRKSSLSTAISKRHYTNKKGQKAQPKSKPLHYISSDGFDIYVGKNNFQNDELTFKFATGNDWWFHAKKMAGSHVIVRTKDGELPDRTFEEAGRLAAYYSKTVEQTKWRSTISRKNMSRSRTGQSGIRCLLYKLFSGHCSDISNIKKCAGFNFCTFFTIHYILSGSGQIIDKLLGSSSG